MKRRKRSANGNPGTDSTDYNSNFDAIADLLQLDAESSMDHYSGSGSGVVSGYGFGIVEGSGVEKEFVGFEGSGGNEGSGGYEGSGDLSNTNDQHHILQRYITNSLNIFFLNFFLMFVKRGL